MRTGAEPLYIEPEWRKPIAICQNPDTISFSVYSWCLHVTPLYRPRREEVECSLSESGHYQSFFCGFTMYPWESVSISFISNPKGWNLPLSIRIRTRLVFSVNSRCNLENQSISPLYLPRREEVECSLSESGHYYFFSVDSRCIHENQCLSPLYRTQRDETYHSLSESGHD